MTLTIMIPQRLNSMAEKQELGTAVGGGQNGDKVWISKGGC